VVGVVVLLSHSLVFGIGTPPTPHPQASVSPLLWFRGGMREKGWGSHNSDEGTYTVVLYTIYVLYESS
jgi:hypothetical protein